MIEVGYFTATIFLIAAAAVGLSLGHWLTKPSEICVRSPGLDDETLLRIAHKSGRTYIRIMKIDGEVRMTFEDNTISTHMGARLETLQRSADMSWVPQHVWAMLQQALLAKGLK